MAEQAVNIPGRKEPQPAGTQADNITDMDLRTRSFLLRDCNQAIFIFPRAKDLKGALANGALSRKYLKQLL